MIKPNYLLLFGTTAIAIMFHSPDASAQANSELVKAANEDFQSADKFDLDLETPAAPGLVMVGVSSKGAAEPGNFKDFAVDVTSIADGDTIKPGVALTGTPYWWSIFRGDSESSIISLDEYGDKDGFERVLARTQISLATAEVKGEESKNGAKIGFGFSSQLLDAQDQKYRPETTKCIQEAWDKTVGPNNSTLLKDTNLEARRQLGLPNSGHIPLADRPEFNELRDKLYHEELGKLQFDGFKKEKATCLETAKDRFNASPSWIVGGGLAAISDNGKLEDVNYGGASLWSTYRMPVTQDGTGAFTFFTRGDLDRDFALKDGGTGEADALLVAIAGVYQTDDLKFDATLSYNYKDYDSPALGDDDFLRYSGTVSVKVREGVWVEATAGAVTNGKFEEEGFGLVNLKLGFGD